MSRFSDWLYTITANPQILSIALNDGDALASPLMRTIDCRFQDIRSRLATKPDDIVRRTLRLILLRSQAFSNSERSMAIMRSLPQLAPKLSLAVEITLKAARYDTEFRYYANKGNIARDRQNWLQGIAAFERALALYPLHRGYRIQLSHCLKEDGQFLCAEIGYRDALALGSPLEEVWPHLEHSVNHGVGSKRIYPSDLLVDLHDNPNSTSSLNLTSLVDLKPLAWLFLGQTEMSIHWTIGMLRSAPRRSQVVDCLLSDPLFIKYNRPLLSLIGRRY